MRILPVRRHAAVGSESNLHSGFVCLCEGLTNRRTNRRSFNVCDASTGGLIYPLSVKAESKYCSNRSSSPAEASKFLDDEIAKWAKVITTAGVKPEQ